MFEPILAFYPVSQQSEIQPPVIKPPIGLKVAMAWLLLVTCAVITLPSHAATTDFLKMPARQSELAQHSILMDVANSGKRIVAVGERGIIVHSSDQGKTWQQANVPTYVTLTAVHFPTPDKGWAVGHEGVVLHTSDGGLSWQMQLDGNKANVQLLDSLQQRISELQQNTDTQSTPELADELDILQMQLDYEQAAAEEGPSKPFLDVWFRNDKEGFVVGAYGMIFRTDDGGNSWQPWISHLGNPDGFHLNAINQAGNTLYIAGEMGQIWRSSNNGKHFEAIKTDYEGSFFSLLANSSSDEVIALGLRGTAFRSSDNGDTWQRLDIQIPVTLAAGIKLSNGRNVIVGYGGAVLSGDDGTFVPYRRKDMMTNLAVTAVNDDHLILVGTGGIRHAHSNGSEMEIAE